MDYPDRPKSNDKCPCKRKTGRFEPDRREDTEKRKQCDHRGKDKSDPLVVKECIQLPVAGGGKE